MAMCIICCETPTSGNTAPTQHRFQHQLEGCENATTKGYANKGCKTPCCALDACAALPHRYLGTSAAPRLQGLHAPETHDLLEVGNQVLLRRLCIYLCVVVMLVSCIVYGLFYQVLLLRCGACRSTARSIVEGWSCGLRVIWHPVNVPW